MKSFSILKHRHVICTFNHFLALTAMIALYNFTELISKNEIKNTKILIKTSKGNRVHVLIYLHQPEI